MSGHEHRIRNRIDEVFDPARLKYICELDTLKFHEFGARFVQADGRYFYFKDNGAKILAVAHLDSVQDDHETTVVDSGKRGHIVFSPVLDDRLGAFVILDLLPKLGVKCDWLLTDGEERGQSTADLFRSKKQYNWMFQFDRAGSDVVTYQYGNKEFHDLLKEVGFDPNYGSFSDIRDLEHLGCKGLNVGVGYQDYHSARAYAWLDDTFENVAKFVRFYYMHRKTRLEHVKKPSYTTHYPKGYGPFQSGERWAEYYRHKYENELRAGGRNGSSVGQRELPGITSASKSASHATHPQQYDEQRGGEDEPYTHYFGRKISVVKDKVFLDDVEFPRQGKETNEHFWKRVFKAARKAKKRSIYTPYNAYSKCICEHPHYLHSGEDMECKYLGCVCASFLDAEEVMSGYDLIG